jgi:hypothetical protein
MTYLDLVQNMEIFTITHPVLGTFSHGEIPALNAHSRSHTDWPLLNVRLDRFEMSPPNGSGSAVMIYYIEVVILDVLLQDRSNEVFLLNNIIQITKDLYVQPFIQNNMITTMTGEPGPYYMAENVFGVRLQFNFEVALGPGFEIC